MTDKKPMVFFPTPEDKKKAIKYSESFIDSFDKEDSLELRAFTLQMLLESFEEVYEIDIRNGMSFQEE